MINALNYENNTTLTELQKYISCYLAECEYSKQLRSQTIKSYSEVFKTFQKIMPEINTIDDLDYQIMNVFFKRLSTRRRTVGRNTLKIGVKPSTVRTYYNKLIAFFRWLENKDIITEVFTHKITKPPLPIYDDEKALNDSDISKIIASITLHNMDNTFIYRRDLLIISLLVYTGLRKGELLGLQLQDVKLNDKLLYVNGKTSKSKKSRYIPLNRILVAQLKSYLKLRKIRGSTCSALITSSKDDTPLTSYGIKHWVQRYKKLSGVRFHLHQTRHTFACSLAKTNADIATIMKVLGHSSIQMTQTYLRSITSEHSRNYIEQLSF